MRIRLAMILSLIAGAVSAAGLDGAFIGVDAAQGMKLAFARSGDSWSGQFTARGGRAIPFTAPVLGQGAEADIEFQGRRHYVRFEPQGVGVAMVRIPYADGGGLQMQNAQTLIFIREGVDLPPRPRRYVDPPTAPGGTIDPEAFVESYAFWPPEGVAYGYGMVRGRYRTLIRLHTLVQTDILWKMCQTRAAPAELAQALRGQGVDCGEILRAIGQTMADGDRFSRFKADVLEEKKALALAIRCSIDFRRNDPECKKSGRDVARAAVSMETVGAVLARY